MEVEWESALEDVSDKIYIRILKPTRSVKRQECWTEEGTHVKNSVKRSWTILLSLSNDGISVWTKDWFHHPPSKTNRIKRKKSHFRSEILIKLHFCLPGAIGSRRCGPLLEYRILTTDLSSSLGVLKIYDNKPYLVDIHCVSTLFFFTTTRGVGTLCDIEIWPSTPSLLGLKNPLGWYSYGGQ